MCAHLLAQRGELDLDAPVARVLARVRCPRQGRHAGVVAAVPPVGADRHRGAMTSSRCSTGTPSPRRSPTQTPLWEPGTQHGYHAVTYGWLVGEVVRRVSGRSLGDFFAEEIAAPLGLDFWIGLPDDEQARVSPLIPMAAPHAPDDDGRGGRRLRRRRRTGRSDRDARHAARPRQPGRPCPDRSRWRGARTRTSGTTRARGGRDPGGQRRHQRGRPGPHVRLAGRRGRRGARCRRAHAERAIEPQVDGPDACSCSRIPFALGFMRHSDISPCSATASFGHYGAGGSVGLADPDRDIAGSATS